ncbi:MAG: hypothetical protein HY811_03335 [Planctomycetes bacterium]|nr:hypothetical protein [Planctomycetota bacterium]
MDAKKEVKITDIDKYFQEWLEQYIKCYAIGLTKIQSNKNISDSVLLGSGTLIKTQNTYGILTAQHVAATLKDSNELGLIISEIEHRHIVFIKDILEVAKPLDLSDYSQGPDLAVIILPPEAIGTLKAKKSFFDISYKREKRLKEAVNYEEGVWFICGFPEEYTKKVSSTQGYNYAKEFYCICGETPIHPIQKEHINGDYDFVEGGVNYNVDKTLPGSWCGISGGGLWHLLLKEQENGSINVDDTILSGVIFYQTEKKENKRYIKCHGHYSIYEKVYKAIIQKYSDG